MISIDLSKQETLDTDPKAIQQTNFTGNLAREVGATMFFIIEEEKEKDTSRLFTRNNCKNILILFFAII